MPPGRHVAPGLARGRAQVLLEKGDHLALEGEGVFAVNGLAKRIAAVVQGENRRNGDDFGVIEILAARIADEG